MRDVCSFNTLEMAFLPRLAHGFRAARRNPASGFLYPTERFTVAYIKSLFLLLAFSNFISSLCSNSLAFLELHGFGFTFSLYLDIFQVIISLKKIFWPVSCPFGSLITFVTSLSTVLCKSLRVCSFLELCFPSVYLIGLFSIAVFLNLPNFTSILSSIC